MLNIIFKLFKIINSETDPHQISIAFCFSMLAGLTPLLSLHNFFVLLLVLILKVNLAAFITGFIFFSGVSYFFDPFFHHLGLFVLTAGPLQGFWTLLYNFSILRLENFNNSIVMGSLLFSILLFAPLFIVTNKLIIKYRQKVKTWFEKSRIIRWFKAGRIYNLYKSVSDRMGSS